MPLVRCAAGCSRLVSVSLTPGANPIALSDPATFSAGYLHCPSCARFWCDDCLAASQCECGVPRQPPNPSHALRLMLGGEAPRLGDGTRR